MNESEKQFSFTPCSVKYKRARSKRFRVPTLLLLINFFLTLHLTAGVQPGTPIWTNVFGPNATVEALAIDAQESVFALISAGSYVLLKVSSHGVPLWTNSFSNPLGIRNYPNGLAVDRDGNAYVTGELSNPTFSDIVTFKYSSDGVRLWTNYCGGEIPGYCAGQDIALQPNGNVVVAAGSPGNGTGYDFTTISYSSDGISLWTNRYDAGGDDYPSAMKIGSGGEIVVAGYSSGVGTGHDILTIKYSALGEPLWTNRFGGTGNGDDEVRDLVIDKNGDVIVTGFTTNTTGVDYVTIKYSSAGFPLWTNQYDGPSGQMDRAYAIAVDDKNNLYVTGLSYDLGSHYDWCTLAYSGAGTSLWTNRYNGPGNYLDVARAITVDSKGNVFVTGNTYVEGAASDLATIAYSSSGSLMWTSRFNGQGSGGDIADFVAVDSNGDVLVAGYTWGGASQDAAVVKYAGFGPPQPWLGITLAGEDAILTWTNSAFNLQSAPAAGGSYADLPEARSPYTNHPSSQQFFRLRSN